MGRLTDQIREYISSPQVDGNEHYGKWGALRKDQRLLIADLCEYCDLQEKYADTFFKEIQSLKRQLAEKDKEIEELKNEFIQEKEFLNKQYDKCDKARKKSVEKLKAIRHQVCEEIRKAFEFWYDNYNIKDIRLWFQMQGFLKLIEQGE